MANNANGSIVLSGPISYDFSKYIVILQVYRPLVVSLVFSKELVTQSMMHLQMLKSCILVCFYVYSKDLTGKYF